MIKKILIIPATVDCNRGDQALVWGAIDFLESLLVGGTQIKLSTESSDPATDPAFRQTFARGYRFNRMLLRNPNRILGDEENNIHYAHGAIFLLALRAVVDFLQSVVILFFSAWPFLVRCFLKQDKKIAYTWFCQADAVVIKGGGFIYSYRGLKYAYYLWYSLFHIFLAQRLNIPVIILPNSFGPFETKFSRWLAQKALKRCVLVTTRETQSQNVLNTFIPGFAQQFPDMAFMLKVRDNDFEWACKELQKFGVKTDGTAVGVTMRPWRFPDNLDPKTAYENYLETMAQFILYLFRQGLQPVLFAHVRGIGKHETDRFALEACQKRIAGEQPILVDAEYNCVQMKALYSYLGYMVGTRFHSCIFAMSQGVPTLAISYQGYKASGIMSDMGLSEFHIHINDVSLDRLVNTFNLLQKKREQVRNICKTYVLDVERKMSDLRLLVSQALKLSQ